MQTYYTATNAYFGEYGDGYRGLTQTKCIRGKAIGYTADIAIT